MNNHNPNNNEQRPAETRALLQQQDMNIDAAQRRSATPEYQITIEHGSIWLGQER